MKTFLLLLLPFCATGVMARTAFDKTGKVAQVGIGIGGLGGFYGTSSLPVISVGLDFGVHEFVSVGGVAGYSSSKVEYPFFALNQSYSYKYSYFTLGVRGSYHFLQLPNEKLDLYGGLGLGFNIVSSKYDGTAINQVLVRGSSGSYMFLGIHAGGRYFFSPNFAAYAELGYGLGILNIGIAFRL
jgi:hypothetical protein